MIAAGIAVCLAALAILWAYARRNKGLHNDTKDDMTVKDIRKEPTDIYEQVQQAPLRVSYDPAKCRFNQMADTSPNRVEGKSITKGE